MLSFAPAVLWGACGGDATADRDAGACPAGQVLRYESPGCGAAAKPVCGSPNQDACYRAVCSCRGQIISRCDFAPEPFANFGACDGMGPEVFPPPDPARDAAADTSGEQARDLPASDQPPIDGNQEPGTDGSLDGESSPIDVAGVDADSRGVIDSSLDAGPCPAGEVLHYTQPGCGAAAKPVCGSSALDGCFVPVCSCKGELISGCGYALEPFASFGPCDGGGPG